MNELNLYDEELLDYEADLYIEELEKSEKEIIKSTLDSNQSEKLLNSVIEIGNSMYILEANILKKIPIMKTNNTCLTKAKNQPLCSATVLGPSKNFSIKVS